VVRYPGTASTMSTTRAMSLEITPEIEAMVRDLYVSSDYADEAEILREALTALDRGLRRGDGLKAALLKAGRPVRNTQPYL
jgi:Arc/MetJ-type ribon-helix-helix transcriptional regulator